MDSELLNLDNLSEEEKLTILKVIKRDEDLRWAKNQQVNHLKNDIHNIRVKSILHDGDDLTKICARCHEPFGFFFNTGDICQQCRFKVCKKCREINLSGSWSCTLCFKQNQLKLLRGDWVKKIGSKKKGKFEHGGDIVKASIRRSLSEGSLLADDDGSPSLARAAGNHRGSMDRAGYPQESDKKRLHQLFESFRSNTTDSDSNASVKHVSCRRRRDSGSSSSSEEGKKGDKSDLYKSVCDSITSSEPGLIPSRPTSETESALNSPVAKPSRLNSKPIETTVPQELTNGNSKNLLGISSDTVSQSSSSENARFSSTESGQNVKRIESKHSQQINQMSNLCPPSASPRQNVRLSPEHSNVHLRKGSGQSDTSSISSARTASPATKMRLLDLASTRALERDVSDGSDNDESLRSRKNKKHSISTGNRENETVPQYEEGSQYVLKSHNLDTTAFDDSCLDGTGFDSFFSLKLDVGSNHNSIDHMLNTTPVGSIDNSACMLNNKNNLTNETYCLSRSSSYSDTLDSLHAPSSYCLTSPALQHFNTPPAQNSDSDSIRFTCTHPALDESSSEKFYTPEAYITSNNDTRNTNTQLNRSSIYDISPLIEDNSKEFQKSQQLTLCNNTFIIDREDTQDSFNIADAVTEEEEPDQKCSKYVLDIKEYVNIDDDDEYNSDSEFKNGQLGETFIYGEADQLLTDLQNDSEVSFLTSPHIDFNAIHKPVPKQAFPITDTDNVSDNLSVISEATEPENSSLSDLASNCQDENDDIDELANKSIDVLFDDKYDLPLTKSRSPRLKRRLNKTPPSTRKHVSFSKETIFKQETNIQSDVQKDSKIPIQANYKDKPEKENKNNGTIDQTASLVQSQKINLKETIINTHNLPSDVIKQEIPQETSLPIDLNTMTNTSKIKSPIVVLSDDVPNITITEDLEQTLAVEKESSKLDMKDTITIPDSQRNKPNSSGAKYSKNGSKLKVQKFMKKVKKNSPRSSPVEFLESNSNSTSSVVDLIKPTEANLREQKSPLPKRRKQNTRISTPNYNERTKSIHIERTLSAQIEKESKKSVRGGLKDLQVKATLTDLEKEMESYNIQSSSLKASSTIQDLPPNDVPGSSPKDLYSRCDVQLHGIIETDDERKTEVERTHSITPIELAKDLEKDVQSKETDSGNENYQETFSSIDKLKWKSNMESVNNDFDKNSERELCDENYVNSLSRDLNYHQYPEKTVNDSLIISQADKLKNSDETDLNSVSIASDLNNQTVTNDFEINTKSCDKCKGIEMRHSKTDVSRCENSSMEVTSCGDHLEFQIQNNDLDTGNNGKDKNVSNEHAIKRINNEIPNIGISTNLPSQMQTEVVAKSNMDSIPTRKKLQVNKDLCLQMVPSHNIDRDGSSDEITTDCKGELSKVIDYGNAASQENDFKITPPKNDCHMPQTEFIMENQDLSLGDLNNDEGKPLSDEPCQNIKVNDTNQTPLKDLEIVKQPCEKVASNESFLFIENNPESKQKLEICDVGNTLDLMSQSDTDNVHSAETLLEVVASPISDASTLESIALKPSIESNTDSEHHDHQFLDDSKQITLQGSSGEEYNKVVNCNTENTGYCVIKDSPTSTTTNLHFTNPNINSCVAMDTNKMLPKVKEGPENVSKQDQIYPSSPNTGESPDMDNSSRQLAQTIPDIHIVSSSSLPTATETDSIKLTVTNEGSDETGSHGDSGHISGNNSLDNTPEHGASRQSHLSVPSLQLSTTSNDKVGIESIDEEDENIDYLVASHRSMGSARSINSRGLSSLFSGSRESILSIYSDAGEINYGKIPVSGEVLLGIDYNYKTGALEIYVKQCKDLAPVDTKRKRSDPYIKTYLLPDKTRGGKRKTKIKKHTLNPVFDEVLRYTISKSEVENRILWIAVWNNDRFGHNDFLGEVTLSLDTYKFGDSSPKWYPLQERFEEPQLGSLMPYKGDLIISLRYITPDLLAKESAKKSKLKKSKTGKGALHVIVKEARNLTALRSNGTSDPFCKGYLLPDKHKSGKQKTPTVKKNCNPVWNYLFVFEDIDKEELSERSLELTIWDHDTISSNDFLGGIRFNLGTGISNNKTVEWMDGRGEEIAIWQCMIDRPNTWIDASVNLRATMGKSSPK